MIAGLEDITAGELTIGGARMNDIPPSERGIAMVFPVLCSLSAHGPLREHGVWPEARKMPHDEIE